MSPIQYPAALPVQMPGRLLHLKGASMTSGPVQQDLGAFDSLLATMRVLRDSKDGCPWDIEQTHRSLRHTLLEETYETLEALDSEEPGHMVEELGDLLIQVVFHAQIGQDNGTFTIQDVIRGINEKLLRRHPHIFGDAHVADSSEVKVQWDQIKAQERQGNGQGDRSALDGVPKSMPALAYAQAIQGRASRAGFAWEDDAQVLAKVAEEVEELKSAASHEEQERELGDLLLSVVNAASRMGVEAEEALRGANNRFYRRYVHMERSSKEQGLQMDKLPLESKLHLWREAKSSTADA